MSALGLSLLLCLVSAVAYAGGAIVQERVAARGQERAYAPVRRPEWWAAVALNGLGAVLHVVALAYGPLSLVQPLGALTIVFALPMAAVFVRRRATAAAWRGALLASAGLAGLLALTGGNPDGGADRLPVAGERALLLAATAAAVSVLFAAAHGVRRPVLRSVLLAVAAGTAFGMASVFTKALAEGVVRGSASGRWPDAAAVAVLACGGLLLSQAAYRGAGLAAPLATLTVVNPVVAAAVGLTLFGEGFRYGAAGTAGALAGAAVAAAGLVVLTAAAPPHTASSDAHAVGAEVLQRVDVGAVARSGPHLEVEVGPAAVAGRSGAADPLAAGDVLPGLHAEGRQVGVLGVPAVGVPDDHLVAVRTGPAGGDDAAGADGPDGRTGRDGEVDARVVAAGPGGSAGLVPGADGGVDGGDVAAAGLLLRR
ncbi:hypothetical protein C0216_12425 [Streptomyces globosus]|uniref:Magnesium transporter NIPA n=1 Tax=Streptomyces globosus TaxID=68209 RepID=A0A344TZT3_9ACTN|nr:hypothetical protein C0216_12425 [Streptomyces globosus]